MGIIDNRDAQFMLLAGFIVAIGLVITTLMLNSIIFQGNTADEAGADPVKYEMVNLMQITGDEMKSAYNHSNGTIANFSMEMKNFSANLSMIYALHGESVNVINDTSNWASDSHPKFTENGIPGGAANWIVIQNVSSSTIIVNVTSGDFYINLTNKTPDWQIHLTKPPGTYIITNSSSTPYAIIFINGNNAAGNYSISGTASVRSFIRARDYILYATVALSASSTRANITIPVSVPW